MILHVFNGRRRIAIFFAAASGRRTTRQSSDITRIVCYLVRILQVARCVLVCHRELTAGSADSCLRCHHLSSLVQYEHTALRTVCIDATRLVEHSVLEHADADLTVGLRFHREICSRAWHIEHRIYRAALFLLQCSVIPLSLAWQRTGTVFLTRILTCETGEIIVEALDNPGCL